MFLELRSREALFSIVENLQIFYLFLGKSSIQEQGQEHIGFQAYISVYNHKP